jgi:hypothetical protein
MSTESSGDCPRVSIEDVKRAFNSLSDKDKLVFTKQFWDATPLTATFMLMFFKKMPEADRMAFANRILNDYLLPLLPAERIHATMDRVVIPQIQKLLKDKKAARDRPSDPETIKRNVEICDLRKQDQKKWSFGRLAKKFDVARQSIANILKEEEKWRKLHRELASK